MFRPAWAIAVLILFSLAALAAGEEGRLQRVREETRPSASDESSASSSSKKNDDNEPILGSIFAGILSSMFISDDPDQPSVGGMIVGIGLLAPFTGPILLFEDRYEHRLPFARHPYTGKYRGYQILPVEAAAEYYSTETKDLSRQNWSCRLSVENGNDFAGLNRINGQLRVEHACRWGVLTNWNVFHERLPSGHYDETVIGDTNITFRFAQNEIASMYTGLGFRVLTDRRQTDYGFNFVYGGDWFPVRPLVVSASFDAGTLGTAGVLHARGSIGITEHGWEIFAGYDYLRIGGTSLQGPLVGIRRWF